MTTGPTLPITASDGAFAAPQAKSRRRCADHAKAALQGACEKRTIPRMLAMPRRVKEVYEYRELLLALVGRDIRVRYKQAVMGALWAFLTPLVAILAGIVVRFAVAWLQGGAMPNLVDIASVMVKTLPYMTFIGILSGTTGGLIGGMQLATKIYFPRQIVPLTSVCITLFDRMIGALLVVLILVLLPGSPLQFTWYLLLVPVCVMLLVMCGLGIGLLFGSANLFLRDVKYIVGVFIQFGIFVTPVYLGLHEFPPFVRNAMLLNPASALLETISHVTLGVPNVDSDPPPANGPSVFMRDVVVGEATFIDGRLIVTFASGHAESRVGEDANSQSIKFQLSGMKLGVTPSSETGREVGDWRDRLQRAAESGTKLRLIGADPDLSIREGQISGITCSNLVFAPPAKALQPGIDPDLWPWLVYSSVFSVGVFVLGFRYFHRVEHLFAELS